jgi:hypothetical protein
MNRRFLNITLLLITCFVALYSCTISYSFTGASISPDVKTYSIYNFPNRATLVNATLSDYLVEQLREKFTRQTSLDYLNDNGDLEFEGTITSYDIQPMAIKADDQASLNRLTIRVKVKFTNNKNSEQDFDTEFSAFSDYDSNRLLSDVEDELVVDIVKRIVEEIFNKSVANW